MGWIRNTTAEVARQSRYPLVIATCAVSTPLVILVIVFRGYHCLRVNVKGRRSFYTLCLSVVCSREALVADLDLRRAGRCYCVQRSRAC
jgi:ABC-type glycerol-3-phosphate transport system permease component